jgi:hypothetical protein
MVQTLTQKKIKKISKYSYLRSVSRMWTVAAKIVPVIVGALRTIKKGSDQKIQ